MAVLLSNGFRKSSLSLIIGWGNGSTMRVVPIGLAFRTLEDVLIEAQKSAEITHNHPEGIKGAQSVADAVFLAKEG
jgi:ADP-ribosylglycohydrolase